MVNRAEIESQPVFPVCLLLRNRRVLVAGAGKVASHKIRLLLDAEADVTVVGPEADQSVEALAEAHAIEYLRRPVVDSDLDAMFMVFAATSDRNVNRRIVERCRERGILCCSVDDNWIGGDFLTPAVFRRDGLTVSVSSGGRSCRRARMIKETLSRHVELLETADLVTLGTSHLQLPVGAREPLHLIGRRLDQAGRMLAQVWGVHEFLLLNTCNRIEVHAVVGRHADPTPLLACILGFDRLEPHQYYVKRGYEAFEHISLLTAGLFSQVPGENHIVSQVKEAL
jgi:siroheme synthase-like protein